MDNDKKFQNDDMPSMQNGIFSTPELTVDTTKITPPPATRTNIAQTKASAKFYNPDQTNELATALQQSRIASTTTEDIQLGTPTVKKKRLIIALALVITVSIMIGILCLVLPKNDKEEQFWKIFDQYASFLYFGDFDNAQTIDVLALSDSDARISQVIIDSSNNNMADIFLTTAQEKLEAALNTFRRAHITTDNDKATAIENLLELSKTRINALQTFISTPDVGADNFMQAYLSGGSDSSVNLAQSTYASFLQSPDAILFDIAKKKIELAKTMNFIFDTYAANGCINNHEIDSTCVETIVWDIGGQQAKIRFNELRNELSLARSQLLDNILNSCRNILRLRTEHSTANTKTNNEDDSYEENLES